MAGSDTSTRLRNSATDQRRTCVNSAARSLDHFLAAVSPVLRPTPKQLAVSLHKCVALARREGFADLVGTRLPHAEHSTRRGVPEAVNERRMVLEVLLQLRPR